jgi:hypothetical protein
MAWLAANLALDARPLDALGRANAIHPADPFHLIARGFIEGRVCPCERDPGALQDLNDFQTRVGFAPGCIADVEEYVEITLDQLLYRAHRMEKVEVIQFPVIILQVIARIPAFVPT